MVHHGKQEAVAECEQLKAQVKVFNKEKREMQAVLQATEQRVLEAGESLKRSTEQFTAERTSLETELNAARTQLGHASSSHATLQQEHAAALAQLQTSQEAARKLDEQVAKASLEKTEAEARSQKTREEYELVWVDLKLSHDQLGEARADADKAHKLVEEKVAMVAELQGRCDVG